MAAFGNAFQVNAFQRSAFQIRIEATLGGGISGGTFSRGKWRSLKDEQERERQARRLTEIRAAKRKRELREATAEQAKAAVTARRLQEDALAQAEASRRALEQAQAVQAGMTQLSEIARQSMLAMTAAHGAQSRRNQDDEEESVAMLMLNS